MATWDFYDSHFSASRLQGYLLESGGDLERAMALYRWNVAISAAFWESFAYFEVAFRNAIDGGLQRRHMSLGRNGHWLFDSARELGRDGNGPGRHRQPYVDIDLAMRRVRQNRKSVDAGQVISELSFGFWHQLVSRKQMFLWPDLASAFPNAPRRDQKSVQRPVGRLRTFRNRIGHHHRVWSQDIGGRHEDLLQVAEFLDADLRTFLDETSRVPVLLGRRR